MTSSTFSMVITPVYDKVKIVSWLPIAQLPQGTRYISARTLYSSISLSDACIVATGAATKGAVTGSGRTALAAGGCATAIDP